MLNVLIVMSILCVFLLCISRLVASISLLLQDDRWITVLDRAEYIVVTVSLSKEKVYYKLTCLQSFQHILHVK